MQTDRRTVRAATTRRDARLRNAVIALISFIGGASLANLDRIPSAPHRSGPPIELIEPSNVSFDTWQSPTSPTAGAPTLSSTETWAYESAAPDTRVRHLGPGKRRPDFLSAPDGWTYAP
jgi:hypothetical protein